MFPESHESHSVSSDSRHGVASGHILIHGENDSQGSVQSSQCVGYDPSSSELPTFSTTSKQTGKYTVSKGNTNPTTSGNTNTSHTNSCPIESLPSDINSPIQSIAVMVIEPEKVYDLSEDLSNNSNNCDNFVEKNFEDELPQDVYPVIDAMIVAMKSNLFPPFVMEEIPHETV